MTSALSSTAPTKIAVIGAGTMGSGIAQVFAQHGYRVTLIDVNEAAVERGRSMIDRQLNRLVERDQLTAEEAIMVLERIETASRLDAVDGAELVIEAVFEDIVTKQSVLREAAEHLGEAAILASNTSSISVTLLAAATPLPDRVAGMHFFNPVPVLPLIEVVRGLQTTDETVQRIVAFGKSIEKQPIVVRDSPGFVANRLLIPMINEAITLLEQGVAELEAIDEIMKLGANHPLGPLQLADLIGLDVCLGIMEVLHRDLGEDKYRPATLLRQMVAAGRLGRKSGLGFYAYG